MSADRLVIQLSYNHLELLVDIDDALKRRFYEIECLRGNWSVRELKRQIHSLYFERSGLSTDKNKLAAFVQGQAEQSAPALNIRNPYIFEFLGLKPTEVMCESIMEDTILDNLQQFLLEMGHGFCFEARQKRILIGDEHYFIDLVFYHRILKCHVLVELKLTEFSHENIGQLNTYVSWYKKNMMLVGDNPPIGILLCTHKKHSLVEFALAGMDNQLFVSKYQLELPKRKEIEQFLEEKLKQKREVYMSENRIAQALNKLFDRHRIIFWYDAKQELRNDFDALQLAGIEKVELINNEFVVKYRLLREQSEQKFLVYREGPQPDDLDNWLLDVQLAHGSFARIKWQSCLPSWS